MSDSIHYLIRPNSGNEGLIYPSEASERNYYGFGAFYLMGSENDDPAKEYSFQAVYGEELIVTTAQRFQDEKNFFSVEVKKIGRFIFYAQAMPKKYPYSGQSALLQGSFAFRRMRSWKPAALDAACREHGFYFVGATPMNRMQATGVPPVPDP